jgi:hypothetical protein
LASYEHATSVGGAERVSLTGETNRPQLAFRQRGLVNGLPSNGLAVTGWACSTGAGGKVSGELVAECSLQPEKQAASASVKALVLRAFPKFRQSRIIGIKG